MIQTLLNHADLATTAVYTKVVDAQTGAAVLLIAKALGITATIVGRSPGAIQSDTAVVLAKRMR